MTQNIIMVDGDESARMYRNMCDIIGDVNLEDPEYYDRQWIRKSLEMMFVTNPIDENEPFIVRRDAECDGYEGLDFHVGPFEIVDKDEDNVEYDIKFHAFTYGDDCYYKFSGKLFGTSPHLGVEYAYIDNISPSGIETNY